jgi:hypothetical protein
MAGIAEVLSSAGDHLRRSVVVAMAALQAAVV